MKIKLVTISGAVKDYANEKRIYEAVLKVDPDLKGYFTIKKLHKKQDYLFSVETDCWKDLGNALTALQVAYVNEDEPCLYISNLPDTYEEADVFQLAIDFGIPAIVHCDVFPINAKGNRSAKIFVGNFYETPEGKQFFDELEPTDFCDPCTTLELPAPYERKVYLRKWVQRPRGSRFTIRTNSQAINNNTPLTYSNAAQHPQPLKLTRGDDDTSIQDIIQQNAEKLKLAELRIQQQLQTQHEETLTQLQTMNNHMHNSNVQLSQIFRRLDLLEELFNKTKSSPQPIPTQRTKSTSTLSSSQARKRVHSRTRSPPLRKKSYNKILPTPNNNLQIKEKTKNDSDFR